MNRSKKQRFEETKKLLYEAQDSLDESLVQIYGDNGGLNIQIINQLIENERKQWFLLFKVRNQKKKPKPTQRKFYTYERIW